MTHTAYIGIGSNVGDPLENCRQAIHLLANQEAVTLSRSSSFYETPPFGNIDQDNFVNAVARISTSLSPQNLLAVLLKLEVGMGRVRKEKWGPRIIDLDILFFDALVLKEEGLEIPHPGIAERQFVLEPLNEIAPGFIHPVLRKTAASLLADHPDYPILKVLAPSLQ